MHAVLICCWALLLGTSLVGPYLAQSAEPGDDLTRNTVRLALGYYFLALNLMLSGPRGQRLVRTTWTLAWLAFVVHVAMAFHFMHDWSHEQAFAHVRAVSGLGEGIFVSYFFTFLWTADVASRWLPSPEDQERPLWLSGLLHAFMLFVAFNATVIFETGWTRWIGAVCFAELAVVGLLRWRGARS